MSTIFNGNALKGRQRFALNLCKINQAPPIQILIHPWEQKIGARSEVGREKRGDGGTTTVLFLARRETFC
jgi:hypothetical protein